MTTADLRKLVSDENFDGDILRGLIRRLPALDVVRVQDVGLSNTADPIILECSLTQCNQNEFKEHELHNRTFFDAY
jgi:hypothetical protein